MSIHKEKSLFSGTAIDVGKQYGAHFASEIKDIIEKYTQLWEKPFEEVMQGTQKFKKVILNYFPHYAQEIEAIARGAGVDENVIYALHCRSEFMPPKTMTECTAIGVPQESLDEDRVLLAQNWDWYPSFLDVTQVVEFQRDDAPKILTLLESGMMAKLGLNEYGVGVTLNFLETKEVNFDGVPVHIVLRAILDCKSTQEAIDLVKSLPLAAAANYLVADATGNIASLETTPEDVHIITGGDYVVHTNVFTGKGEPCNRMDAFVSALAFGGKSLSSEHIKHSFCANGVLQPNEWSSPGIETVHALVMDLTHKTMEVASGKDHQLYQPFSFE